MIGCAIWGTICLLLFAGTVFTDYHWRVNPKGWDKVKQWINPKLNTAGLLWILGGLLYAIWWWALHA